MNRQKIWANRILLAVLTLQFAGCFLSQRLNGVAARFTSLMSFFALGVLCLAQADIAHRKMAFLKDKEVWIAGIGSAAALLNLFLIGSNKGAFLTAADVLLMLYASGFWKIRKADLLYASGLGSALLIWWYGNVKWDYNFNMVGMVYITICVLGLVFLELLREKIWYAGAVQVLLYVTCVLFCMLYHARCAMMGLIVFGVLYLLADLVYRSKVLSALLVFGGTAGSLIFTLLYMLMGQLGLNIRILYKDVLSGRQDIWAELWQAFLKQPLTGIGSSYELKSFFIFEVHNGLLDILAVHGIFVFACVAYLLCKRLWGFLSLGGNALDPTGEKPPVLSRNLNRIRLAGVFAILFTSFFENFFIVSPYLLVVMILIAPAEDEEKAS